MATPDQLSEMRRRAALEADDEIYTDTLLGALIDGGSVLKATLQVWREKAAAAAELVSVSEAGSSRSMNQVIDNAKYMVSQYEKLVAAEDATAGIVATSPKVVPIVRP